MCLKFSSNPFSFQYSNNDQEDKKYVPGNPNGEANHGNSVVDDDTVRG